MTKLKGILQVEEILLSYSNDIKDMIQQYSEDIAKEGVDKLRNTSNTYTVRTGKYNKSWTSKTVKGDGYVHSTIYNNKNYRLTHLLEYGHATRNGGKTREFRHIKPVEDYCVNKYTKEVEEAIKNGRK